MSHQQFEGKVIAITGAASGIGLATAKLLASRGARLSIADINEKNLETAVQDVKSASSGSEVIATAVDVRNVQQVDEWIKKTKSHFGRLDGAANMAGVIKAARGASVASEDEDNWSFILGVNLTGTMHCVRAELQHLESPGSIVNAASILGIIGTSGGSAYSVSKHGVVGLTRSAAKDAGRKGIRVNCIAPGYIRTPMLSSAMADLQRAGPPQSQEPSSGPEPHFHMPTDVALGRMGEPEEVARLIAFLLSEESSFITGNCVSIDGGWNC